ncbi:hypothetical protein AAVH_27992, partial [Aphelenchoides avenae]
MADPSAEVLPTLLQYDEASGGKHKDVVVREHGRKYLFRNYRSRMVRGQVHLYYRCRKCERLNIDAVEKTPVPSFIGCNGFRRPEGEQNIPHICEGELDPTQTATSSNASNEPDEEPMEVGPFAEPMEAECSAAVVQEERENPVASPLSTVSLEHIMEQDEHFQIERYLGIDQFSPGKWAELHVLEEDQPNPASETHLPDFSENMEGERGPLQDGMYNDAARSSQFFSNLVASVVNSTSVGNSREDMHVILSRCEKAIADWHLLDRELHLHAELRNCETTYFNDNRVGPLI